MSDYTRKAMAEARHRLCDYRSTTIAKSHDASAELKEAVELFLGERMREFTDSRAVDDDLVALAGVLADDTNGECLTFLRSRAADRSGKK